MSKGKRGKQALRNPNPLLIAGGFLASVLSLGAYQMVSTKTPPPVPPTPTPPDTTSSTPVITPTTEKPSATPSVKATPTPKPSVSKVYRLPPTPTPRAKPVTPVTPKHEKPSPTKAPPPPAPKPAPAPPSVTRLAALLSFLQAQVGKPYVFGATGPGAYDCSGLIQTAFSRIGVTLPRTSESQSAIGYGVPLSAIRPGDILYWGSSGTAGHTAVYIGGGQFVAAQNSRVGVVLRPVAYDPPSGARRIQI